LNKRVAKAKTEVRKPGGNRKVVNVPLVFQLETQTVSINALPIFKKSFVTHRNFEILRISIF